MKKYKGIIFDIDGTLTSTNELIYAAFNHITNKYLNKTLSNEEITALFGPTEDKILEDFLPDKIEEVKKDYYDFYSDNHFMADIYPGIKELLDELKQKEIKLGIFTGKGNRAATITLKKLGIYDHFDLLISGDEVEEHKPSPEGINLFLEKFNLSANEVLMIGDSPVDVKASHSAGVDVVSVLWDDYAKKDEVKKLNPDNVVNTVDKLKEFLKGNLA